MGAGMRLGVGCTVALIAGAAGIAGGQTTVTDAQVESNVLRALASTPDLASEGITTQTVYGTVTLSGSVSSEARRVQAEKLAANADGVKKVVDELRLNEPEIAEAQSSQGPLPQVLQSDGTYAPAVPATQDAAAAPANPAASAGSSGDQTQQQPLPGSAPAEKAQRNNPDADQALDQQMQQQASQGGQSPAPNPASPPQPPVAGQNQPYPAPGYPPADAGRRPMYNPNYPGYPAPYPPQGSASYPPYPSPYAQQGGPVPGAQQGGESVVIPSGAMVRVRLDRPLSSNRTPAGTPFDGVVVNDVVAGNQVAIPRGASVRGTVVDATSSGALKGRGEISIQLTGVTLGGRSYPLTSDVWGTHGRDKTIETVNKTAGFGAVGAVIGALAGGGVGAAVGGGVGAAAGLGSSAASGDGQVYLPAEALVTFHTVQPTTVTTVSEQEMQRLAYGVPAGGAQPRGYRRAYPRVYGGPGYYPGYYPGYPPYGSGPYGYPNY